MRKAIFFLFIILIIISVVNAQDKFHERKYALIEGYTQEQMSFLLRGHYDIAKVMGEKIYIYLNAAELQELQSRGFDVTYIVNPSKVYADWLKDQTWNSQNPMDDYHTYEELTAELQAQAAANPSICHLFSAGQSMQGRELWVFEMSDNVLTEEDEPEFFWVSSMHGDEVVGMEMCMYMIDYMIDNYLEDPEVQFLVNETHIYFMPSMNPDGTAAHSRYNAAGFDLNRQFPDRIDDPYNLTAGRPTEVQVMMNFNMNHSPVLSANYHGGTMVMNYPYDSNPNFQSVNTPSPDDAWFIDLSLAYSSLNLPMYTGPFPQGITNGAAWYAIYGGMQDWCYNWKGRSDVTIEVSVLGWPPAQLLPGYWEDNRESMLAYMQYAHQGVRGIVTDAVTGAPLDAIVTVSGNSHEYYTDPDVGDYHRLLLPGTYTMNYYRYGYEPVTVENVIVVEGQATRVDVEMELAAPGYSFDDLEGSVSGYTHGAVGTGFTDQWHLSEQRSMTPIHSWKCGAAGTGNYANLLHAALVTPVLTLQENSVLSFWQYMHSETSSMYYPYAYDGGLVEIKEAGDSVWTQIFPVGGYPYLIRNTSGSGPFAPGTPVFAGHIEGREAIFNLSGFSGQAQFRFRFGSDNSTSKEGWYIDDIELDGGGVSALQVVLTPDNPPITIPAAGGMFSFNIEVSNAGAAAQTVDIWTNVTMPAGTIYGPIINVSNFTLNPGMTLDRDRNQNVPAGAPAGNYVYNAYMGDYPGVVLCEDHFDFVKSAVDGSTELTENWSNWGEYFAGEMVFADNPAAREFSLAEAYPNPFNSTVMISYSLKEAGMTQLKLYDVTGRQVQELDSGWRQAGDYQVKFSPENLSSGVYFVSLESGGKQSVEKLVYIK